MVSEKNIDKPFICPILTGPTATGKTELSVSIVETVKKTKGTTVEIINADSLSFYEELNIGTAKPDVKHQHRVKHHLINWKKPDASINAGEFRKTVFQILANQTHPCLIVGGSGFYLKAIRQEMWKFTEEENRSMAVLRESHKTTSMEMLIGILETIDPDAIRTIEPNDRYRVLRAIEIGKCTPHRFSELQKQEKAPDPRFPLFVLERSEEEMNLRIQKRTQLMLSSGWIDEVKSLLQKYGDISPLHSVGYQQILDYLNGVEPPGRKLRGGRSSLEGLEDEINLATRQLVKQQMKWFRNQPEAVFFRLPEDHQKVIDTISALYSI